MFGRRGDSASLRSVVAGGIATGAALIALGTSASATTCSTVSACVFGINTRTTTASGFGADAGVSATSLKGDGLDAETTFASSSSASRAGVAGFDESTSGAYNSGVYGFSGKGFGLHGTTTTGTGVFAVATSASGVAVRAGGVGHAIVATFQSGTGLSVTDGASIAHTNNTGLTVSDLGDGVDVGVDFGTGLSVAAGPMGSGAIIRSAGGDGLDIDQSGAGIPLLIDPQGASQDEILVTGLFALDPSGDLTISGSLTQNGTPMSITRTVAGNSVRTYAAREAESTLEDVGETTVAGGRGAVVLDPAFAATVDPSRPYYVFLTAEGENRGLYVTSKTLRGFVIRETNGGTSTLAVQYRIVAKPYDANRLARLAAIDTTQLPYAKSTTLRRHLAQVEARSLRSQSLIADPR